MPFSVHFRGIDELVRDLRVARKRALPHAVRNALNTAAFEAKRAWGDEVAQKFTNRNTWTAGRAIQVVKAQGTELRKLEARVGSTADFMGRQEHGGTVRGRSGHRPIPGPTAAGQASGGKRTKLVRAVNRLSAIRAAKAGKGVNRRQRNAIAIAMARRSGQKRAVLERPKGGKGLFAIGGSLRKPKARLLWDLSRRSARVPAHPTLEPALKKLTRKMEHIFMSEILAQLRRHRVLGY